MVEGLRSFAPDPEHNWGRLNTYSLPSSRGPATVIMDMAHNEAGLEALLEVARGLAAPGGAVRLASVVRRPDRRGDRVDGRDRRAWGRSRRPQDDRALPPRPGGRGAARPLPSRAREGGRPGRARLPDGAGLAGGPLRAGGRRRRGRHHVSRPTGRGRRLGAPARGREWTTPGPSVARSSGRGRARAGGGDRRGSGPGRG